MKRIIDKILNEYSLAKTQTFSGHPIGSFFRNEIPEFIYNTGIVDRTTHLVTGSVGQGQWATVPWVCIFNKKITTTATKGVYIVYLLAKDGKTLYLTFNQGCTDIRNANTKRKTIEIMRSRANEIISEIDSRGFNFDENINLGADLTELAELYQKGTIFYKAYKQGVVPSNEDLLKDLKNMMEIYNEYVNLDSKSIWWPSKEEFDINITKEQWKKYILEVEKPNHISCIRMLKAMMEMGGEASCKELSNQYGGSPTVYIGCAVNIGKRVKKYYNLPACMDGDIERFFPFAFLGRRAGDDINTYIYRIRPELYEALKEIDLSDISPYYESEHKTGHFDSWEIIDDVTAIKSCDKSFFDYNGSGVPKEICWFFDAEEISTGQSKIVSLIYNGEKFVGKLSNDTTDRRRIQIRWNSDLGNKLKELRTDSIKAKFVKIDDGVYEINMQNCTEFFARDLFERALIAYKEEIKQGWLKSELYKWEAVKHFQDNWDINAADFKEMWITAAGKTFNLLGNENNFPRRMISEFAQADKEAVRQMFKDLFDDTKDLTARIDAFKNSSEELRVIYGEKEWGSHFQTANAITTYLWLRYPDKYYIYKYTDCKNAAEKIGCGLPLKKGDNEGVINIFKLFDAIAEEFKKDAEMQEIKNTYLNSNCYNDPMFRTFAIDFMYFVSRKYKNMEKLEGGEIEMSIKEKIENIKAYIAAKGFNYEGNLIENFYLSLKSKPFVILAGTSGTGKTKLVKLFAQAIGAKLELVPVRPDWSDSSDLFGHVDLAGNFKPGVIIDFIKQAELDKNKPYILCLDEMNLARVEYYLSDFLSIIETRERLNGEIVTDALVKEEYYQNERAREKYGKLITPENLYIVGTVNMDETTFPFSKKVLDRANTIEFSFVNFMPKQKEVGVVKELQLGNDFLKTKYLYLSEIKNTEFVEDICFKLEELNNVLKKANLHVGYRVRDEISFYMINNKKFELLGENIAFDNEIMQKILPRIQGSSATIKQLLSDLFVLCAGDYTGLDGSFSYEQMDSYIDLGKYCKYPNSARKIVFMMRRYEEDGFTSYWL